MVMKVNKTISLVVAIVMMISTVLTPTISFASDNSNVKDPVTLQEVYNIYEENCDLVTLVSETENRLIYDVQIKDIDGGVINSEIEATINAQGNQVLDITEGEKREIVTIDSNRNLYVDGELVKITDLENSINGSEIVTMGAHRIYWQETAPYAKGSAYTKKHGTVKKSLEYTKPLKDATASALVSIIVLGLGLSGAGSIAVGFIASGVISWFGKNDPKGKAWSVKDVQYVHNTKGFTVKTGMSVIKHNFTYYSNTDCTGKIGSGIRYQVYSS